MRDDSDDGDEVRPIEVGRSALRMANAMSDPSLKQGIYAGTVRKRQRTAQTKFADDVNETEGESSEDEEHEGEKESEEDSEAAREQDNDEHEPLEDRDKYEDVVEKEEEEADEDDEQESMSDVFGSLAGELTATTAASESAARPSRISSSDHSSTDAKYSMMPADGISGGRHIMERALHTRNQKALWDEWLELLIGLQRLVRIAARLPQPHLQGTEQEQQQQRPRGPVVDRVSLSDFVSLNKRCASRVHETDGALLKLLHSLLRVRDATSRLNPALPVAPSDAGRGAEGRKGGRDDGEQEAELRSAETALSDGNEEVAELARAKLQRARLHERSRARDGSFNGSFSGDDLTDLWREVHNGYEALAPYRDEVLEQWHRKAQLASGASVLLGKGFNASGTTGSNGNTRGGGIAAGIMNQVRAVMGDTERMRKRSFMRAA